MRIQDSEVGESASEQNLKSGSGKSETSAGKELIRNPESAIRNEKGLALVMVLVLSAMLLAIMAGLIYMITASTQVSGVQKRYKTALEAGVGGAEVAFQYIATRGKLDLPLQNYYVTPSACVTDKMTKSTSDWNSCNKSVSIDPSDPGTYDIQLDLGISPTYRVYAKIIDTVEGNSGGDEGLQKSGVIAANSGEVNVMSRPYLYTIEVEAQRLGSQPSETERAKLSVLYQY